MAKEELVRADFAANRDAGVPENRDLPHALVEGLASLNAEGGRDEQAWARFYEGHKLQAVHYIESKSLLIKRLRLAEDVFQIVCHAMLRAIRNGRVVRDSERACLYAAIRHEVWRMQRKLRRNEERDAKYGSDLEEANVYNRAVTEEVHDRMPRVREAVETLGEPYRTAVKMRYLEDRKYHQIAEAMDATVERVRLWVCRGLQKLRESLFGGSNG